MEQAQPPLETEIRAILDALRQAPPAWKRSAVEAIEAGNLETFITLAAEHLRTADTRPRIESEWLDRANWDQIAARFLEEHRAYR